MKNYFRVLISLAVLFVLGLVLAFLLTRGNSLKISDTDKDSVMLNDIAATAAENWADLSVLDEKKFKKDYVVLDNNNMIRYQAIKGENDLLKEKLSIERAINYKLAYTYVMSENGKLGSVIILDDDSHRYRIMRYQLILGFAAMGLIFLLGTFLYGNYVKKHIVTPFDNMKDFAENVAMGNLNEPLMMDQDNLFGAFTESFDIMREELSNSKKREVELQRREKELIASLSHDLKTPITGIKLTTELLMAKNPDNKDMLDKLDNIYMKADQIDNLVSDIFTSTLDDLGEFKVNCKDEPSSVLTTIIKKYDDKELVTSSELPGVMLNIDKKRMSQVIGNVISNSYKYAGTSINVSYKVIDDYLEMRIQDYGPGVPENEISLITNKFFRGKQWIDSDEDGNGLGLYIARTLMEKMNGELLPENSGDGFVVSLLIPLS